MGIDVTELLDLDFDDQFSIGQGTRQDIKSDKKGFKFKDVEINLDPKRGIGNRNKVEDEEVEDALRNIQESLTKTKVADIKAKLSEMETAEANKSASDRAKDKLRNMGFAEDEVALLIHE